MDKYKHQWHVVEAVHKLRLEGFNLNLILIGSSTNSALKRLNRAMVNFDPERIWVNYYGKVPYVDLHHYYSDTDMGLFASSCENMPNILLETMASVLPVVCSKNGPMAEVLDDGGLYFNPESPIEISDAIRQYLVSPELRREKSKLSFAKAKEFSWETCADKTFKFLVRVLNSK